MAGRGGDIIADVELSSCGGRHGEAADLIGAEDIEPSLVDKLVLGELFLLGVACLLSTLTRIFGWYMAS